MTGARATSTPHRGGSVGPEALADQAALALGALVLLWFAAASTIAAAAFALGHALPRATAPLALLGAAAATWALVRRSRPRGAPGAARLLLAVALAGAVLAAASAALALAFLDLGDDGQTYHLSAVIRMAEGWNPWHQRLSGPGLFYGWALDHYPRASYVAAAALYLATGALETTKATQLLLAGAAGTLAWAAARRLLPGSPRAAAAVAVLAACNPVVIVQLATNYLDGLLGSALLAFTAALVLLAAAPTPLVAACAVASGALACGLKFTGVADVVVLGAGAALVTMRWMGKRRGVACACAGLGALALAAVLEANPYLTNAAAGGNPFWPIVGGPPGPWSTMGGDEEGEQTASFAAHGRATKLVMSLLARADSQPGVEPGIRLKVPFSVHRRELGAYRAPDTRASGFGPLFSGALALALPVLGLAVGSRRRRPDGTLAASAALVVVASALAMPYPWWARYVPQLWIVPVIVMIPGFASPSRALRSASAAIALALAANLAVVAAVHFAGEVRGTRAHRAQLARLAALSERYGPIPIAFGRTESHRLRLRAHGVRFVEERLPCPAPVQLLSLNDTRICPPAPVATVIWPG